MINTNTSLFSCGRQKKIELKKSLISTSQSLLFVYNFTPSPTLLPYFEITEITQLLLVQTPTTDWRGFVQSNYWGWNLCNPVAF